LFNSVEFFIFFFVVTATYFVIPHKYRYLLLLLSSCYFYMAFVPIYILILGFTIVIDYFAGILIERTQGKRRKHYLILSLVSNILVLAVFKYYNFFNENITQLMLSLGYSNPIPYLSILLPIGLSFHTFQAMSYTIEVYRGNQPAVRNFGVYSLYVMFYPQLVAGPIERPQNLLHQFTEKHNFDYKRVTSGLKLMVWGLFKKVVIADRLSLFVDQVYDDPTSYQGLSLIVATLFFTFQIYCDFSGYSDMALGAAEVMGFKLMQNFKRPYFSKTISEFWKRWHISLSSWFKDYVYIPLGGNRGIKWRWYFNLFIVFLLSGFWHGANWTFVIWGALHGFYLIFALITRSSREKLNVAIGLNKFPRIFSFIQIVTTFLLVSFAWIFFRADSLSDAYYICTNLFTGLGESISSILNGFAQRGQGKNVFSQIFLGQLIEDFVIAVLAIALMECVHYKQRSKSMREVISKLPFYVRWAGYYAIILAILFLGVYGQRQFIYFQF
ncbi:MAG: MBOAT family protein, partial [Bacteroidia bacterium]|nr:MBOAT family protein [Bacteroidia bacterium]